MRRSMWITVMVVALAVPAWSEEQSLPWTQLSLSTCGVDRFHRNNPELDGRGVVIAVLDTGVDMGIPGLTHTPQGEVKVIDVQDFTGQGDVALEPIVQDAQSGAFVHYAEDGSLEQYRFAPVASHPAGTRYFFGSIEESRFVNSSVPDINDNDRGDDTFGLLVVVPPGGGDDQAEVYVDTDIDRDWSDENPIRNYHLNYDTFQFARQKREQQIAPLTCALNILLNENKVVVHFDDGGHGTHVAGIAAGYRINGQKDFHGVAPGARIISLKIGNNTLAGGATTTGSKKKAFEYAARYAHEHNVPVVCNLSYGIGSEIEGHSDIDQFLDRLCRENPQVVVFTSAGNEGPGLSTVGTPAAASAVISVAALLGADSARDVMGVDMKTPQVAVFSSRGGELSKPTVAVPGYATSTVPRWNRRGDFWRGTSMASPYAAGMGALLVCGAESRYPDRQHRSSWIKEALRRSASPMFGYTPLDYGAGIPEMSTAMQRYEQMVSTLGDDVLFDYEVKTESPLASGGEAPAAYWRSTYYPSDRSQVFTVAPRFVPALDAQARALFSRQYEITTDAEWLLIRQQQVYFRSEQPATVRVDYDTSKLTEPGLYVGAVRGSADGQVGFALVNTVIVPHAFNAANDYRLQLPDQVVEGWQVRRHFFEVPVGATAMHLNLEVPEGQFSDLRARELFRPNGTPVGNGGFYLDTRAQQRTAQWSMTRELEPGVWELCVHSSRPDERSFYNLDVRFSGVHSTPGVITDWDHGEGGVPGGSLRLTQMFDEPLPVKARGMIEGYEVTKEQKITPEEDVAEHRLQFNPQIKAVRIEVEFSGADFARFTDVAINVFDGKGTAIAKTGMSYRRETLTVDNPSPGAESTSCQLEIQGAFTSDNADLSATAGITLTYLYDQPIEIQVTGDGNLYPGIARQIKFRLAKAPPQTPAEAVTSGYIRVTNAGTDEPVLTIPVRH